MKLIRYWKSERGIQTLEWVALALVVLALIGAVTSYLNGPGGAQVAAPIQEAMQRYAWCLEGAGACPGAGWAGTGNIGVPGGQPRSQPPGVQPPGAQPPGNQSPGSGTPGSGSGGILDRIGQWARDRWEDAQRIATETWEALKAGARAAWNWIDQHKGIVAGVIVGGLALLLGFTPLGWAVAIGAAIGALLFGILYQSSGPRSGWEGWLEAFLIAGQGAVIGGMLGHGIVGLLAKGLSMMGLQVMGLNGIIGGSASFISYWLTTPPGERDLVSLGLAVASGALGGILAGPIMSGAVAGLFGTIEAARQKRLRWYTPAKEFGIEAGSDLIKSRYYDPVFGKKLGRGIGKLRATSVNIKLPKTLVRIVNRVSFEAPLNFVKGLWK